MEVSTLGKRLQTARKRKGLTQAQLASEAKIALATITRLEQGQVKQIRTDSLCRLATALNVSTDYLLGHKMKKE